MKLNPVQGKILISPYKEIMVTRTITELDEEKNKGKNPVTDVMDTKKVKKKVRANFQLGTVICSFEDKYKEGVIVAYKPAGAVDFDLIKGTKLVEEYAIVGICEDI
jgi:hypothetical protein